MATNALQETDEQERELEDQIAGKIVKMGCACATDLATQIGGGRTAKELAERLEGMVKKGILRHKEDKKDSRSYDGEYQIVYELDR